MDNPSTFSQALSRRVLGHMDVFSFSDCTSIANTRTDQGILAIFEYELYLPRTKAFISDMLIKTAEV